MSNVFILNRSRLDLRKITTTRRKLISSLYNNKKALGDVRAPLPPTNVTEFHKPDSIRSILLSSSVSNTAASTDRRRRRQIPHCNIIKGANSCLVTRISSRLPGTGGRALLYGSGGVKWPKIGPNIIKTIKAVDHTGRRTDWRPGLESCYRRRLARLKNVVEEHFEFRCHWGRRRRRYGVTVVLINWSKLISNRISIHWEGSSYDDGDGSTI